MADLEWAIHAQEFAHCNCSYGCPCQFDALPTHGDCKAVIGFVIDHGFHGATAQGKISMTLADSHAHFAELHLSGKGILH